MRTPPLRRPPWLVLVQGLAFDRFGWDPVLRGLRRHFRLLLFGGQRRPATETMRRYVENALAPATIARRPELVDHLVAHQRAHRPDPADWRAGPSWRS